MTNVPPASRPYVRSISAEEIPALADIGMRAFLRGSEMNYFGNVKAPLELDSRGAARLRTFIAFLVKACFLLSPEDVRVAVLPAEKEGGAGQIASFVLWLPPRKRISLWRVPHLLRAGVISPLGAWKLTGLLRVGIEYPDKAEHHMHAVFKKRFPKETPKDSFYCQLVATDPAFQGRGMVSLLFRDAYAQHPDANWVTEATSAKSRDQYAHLGWTTVDEIVFGKGKVDAHGIAAKGKEASGWTAYCMVKRAEGKN